MTDPGNIKENIEGNTEKRVESTNPVDPNLNPVSPDTGPVYSTTNPVNPDTGPVYSTPNPVYSGASPVAPTPQVTPSPRERPGLVTFASIMMFVLAGFQIVFAIDEFMSAAWVAANVYGTFGGPLWVWGIIDLALAALAIYAGYDLLRGGTNGRIFGLIIASFTAIRWFFYLPASPLLAIVVIAVAVTIIYGLAVNSEYFALRAPGHRSAV